MAAPAPASAGARGAPAAAAKTLSESLTSLWESDAAPSSSNTCQRGAKRVRQSTVTANEDEEEAFGELFEEF
jgi:hypothetical protein